MVLPGELKHQRNGLDSMVSWWNLRRLMDSCAPLELATHRGHFRFADFYVGVSRQYVTRNRSRLLTVTTATDA
jgi:hypothetical protein